ncbi:hypothetical protein [Lentibacillus cibarius]|uniref:Uncharacterized protein n=1 Tax=Lentibacillus cibarius TaxID=2583219 RepID=A0A5S3QI85_9BACI|nr:hypothetical protein [Lentibacillus cibarius]TMN21620.1 hypothetical protein FFL34_05480 [Lentibacillus cibarius]
MMTVENKRHPLRPASEVMKLERIGAFRLTSLSFLRILMRHMMRENWTISCTTFELDDEGHGHAIYSVQTPKHDFSFLAISTKISDEERSDRVISQKWDVTFALSEGTITAEKLNRMKENLPKQEAGRGDASDLVWSRANKSNRIFDYVIDCLVAKEQPDPKILNEVGYLLRTTAVYGNGKFGIAPYEKLKDNHPFNGPFQAQMFAVYMLRHFSFDLVEHIAKRRNPEAVSLDPEIKRFIGTGNATGLGMAPFLISHPRLIHQWIYVREKAIARVKDIKPSQDDLMLLIHWLDRVANYFDESRLIDRQIFVKPEKLAEQSRFLKERVLEYLEVGTFAGIPTNDVWEGLSETAVETVSIEMQELLHTVLLEIYADHVIDLEQCMNVEETYQIVPRMSIQELIDLIHRQYQWVFQYDFTDPDEKYYFWYRSEEKEEPRIGVRGEEPGDDWEMPMNIAEQVQGLYEILQHAPPSEMVASFILRHPRYKGIIQRIQSLEGYEYGEIQANLLSKHMMPLHLLRCKLSFFGAERFNPKSNRWVRITLFQGAPLVEEIGEPFPDNWVFPHLPTLEGDRS